MTRRKLLLTGAALISLLVGGGLVVWLMIPPFPVRVFNRLRLGMTRSEVQAEIGSPPGYYVSESASVNRRLKPAQRTDFSDDSPQPNINYAEWNWDEGQITVFFDKSQRSQGIYLMEAYHETLLDRLRSWINKVIF